MEALTQINFGRVPGVPVRAPDRASGRVRATLQDVRELRLVGAGPDGRSLVVELNGEHLVLPLESRLLPGVREVLLAAAAAAAKVEAEDAGVEVEGTERPGPREIQRRLRGGESVAEVAAATSSSVAWVTRFSGPPLAERAYQARLARAAMLDTGSLDAATLEQKVAAYSAATGDAGAEPEWDAWLAEDGDWRVVAVLGTGAAACWAWRPAAARLTPVERTAKLVTPGLGGGPGTDVLSAVLRPVGAPRADAPVADGPAPAPRRGRAAVPSWEEISSTTTRPDS